MTQKFQPNVHGYCILANWPTDFKYSNLTFGKLPEIAGQYARYALGNFWILSKIIITQLLIPNRSI